MRTHFSMVRELLRRGVKIKLGSLMGSPRPQSRGTEGDFFSIQGQNAQAAGEVNHAVRLTPAKQQSSKLWTSQKEASVTSRLAQMEADGKLEEELTAMFELEVGARGLIRCGQFTRLCTEVLQIDLTEVELHRIFDSRAFASHSGEHALVDMEHRAAGKDQLRHCYFLHQGGRGNAASKARDSPGAAKQQHREQVLDREVTDGSPLPHPTSAHPIRSHSPQGFISVIKRRGFLSSVFTIVRSRADHTVELSPDFDFERPTGGPEGQYTAEDEAGLDLPLYCLLPLHCQPLHCLPLYQLCIACHCTTCPRPPLYFLHLYCLPLCYLPLYCLPLHCLLLYCLPV